MISSKVISFKIKKPKIIKIINHNFNELTCFIFLSKKISLNNTNKKIKLCFFKLFLNQSNFHILHKKYDYSDVKLLFDYEVIRIYNRNNIRIYIINLDYSLHKIEVEKNLFMEKKYLLFYETTSENNYKLIDNNILNSNLNNVLRTPYFYIKLKYILKLN